MNTVARVHKKERLLVAEINLRHIEPETLLVVRVVLPGSIRSKKNSKRACMVGGKHVPKRAVLLPSKAYVEWEKQARKAVMSQVVPHRAIQSGPVHVRVTAYYKGGEPDLSGILESVGDCLEGILWEDDKQIVSWDGSRKLKDSKDPRTVVEVLRVDEVNQHSLFGDGGRL